MRRLLIVFFLLLIPGLAFSGSYQIRSVNMMAKVAANVSLRSDDFNRSNEAPLANGKWTQTVSWNSMQITSQQATPTTSRSASYWSADTFDADQYSAIKVVTTDNAYAGPFARYSNSSGFSAYMLCIEYGELRLKRANGGSQTLNTVIATGVSINGKILKIEVSGTGSTVTIKAFVNGVQAGSAYLDTSADRLLSGQPGIQSAAGGVLDDFEAGEL